MFGTLAAPSTALSLRPVAACPRPDAPLVSHVRGRYVTAAAAKRGRPSKKAVADEAAEPAAAAAAAAGATDAATTADDAPAPAAAPAKARRARAAKAPAPAEDPGLVRSSRGRRGTRAAAPGPGVVDPLAAIRGQLVKTDPETGDLVLDRGHLGGGRPQWWVINAVEGREVRMVELLLRDVNRWGITAPDDVPEEDLEGQDPTAGAGRLMPREEGLIGPAEGAIRGWFPRKQAMVYNPANDKLVERQVFHARGVVYLHCVMNAENYDVISQNVFFLGWRPPFVVPYSGVFLQRNGLLPEGEDPNETINVPVPLPASMVQDLLDWEALAEEESVEERRREVYGDAGGDLFGRSERRDTDPDSRDVDEHGRKIYKKSTDQGSYMNPSGWSDGPRGGGAREPCAAGRGRGRGGARGGGGDRYGAERGGGDWDASYGSGDWDTGYGGGGGGGRYDEAAPARRGNRGRGGARDGDAGRRQAWRAPDAYGGDAYGADYGAGGDDYWAEDPPQRRQQGGARRARDDWSAGGSARGGGGGGGDDWGWNDGAGDAGGYAGGRYDAADDLGWSEPAAPKKKAARGGGGGGDRSGRGGGRRGGDGPDWWQGDAAWGELPTAGGGAAPAPQRKQQQSYSSAGPPGGGGGDGGWDDAFLSDFAERFSSKAGGAAAGGGGADAVVGSGKQRVKRGGGGGGGGRGGGGRGGGRR